LHFARLIGGHSDWAGGHQPAQCGGRLACLVSLQLPPFHPPSRRNNAHLRFLNRLRRRRSNHCFSLRDTCSGSRCDGRLLRLLRSLRGDLCLRLPRWSILKIAKRSCENVTGPQEEINFSVKLSDYFCTCHAKTILSLSGLLCRNPAPVGIDCALITVCDGSKPTVNPRRQERSALKKSYEPYVRLSNGFLQNLNHHHGQVVHLLLGARERGDGF
jgi:hypothetical protein